MVQLIVYHRNRNLRKYDGMRVDMQSLQGKLYLTGAFALAGTSVVTGYLLSSRLPEFTIMAVSMGFALVGLLPFYAAKVIRTVRMLTRRDWLMLLSQAAFGIFLFRLFLLFGVTMTSTAEAGVLTGTTPAITAVLAYFVLKERPSAFTAAGIGGTVAGILLLQGNSLLTVQFSARHLLGNALILCAAASESTFNIIARKHQAGEHNRSPVSIHPIVQALLVAGITLCLSIVPALLEHPADALRALGWQEWLALVWYGFIITAVAFAFFFAGAKRCNAYTIAAFSGMMPLTAILLSMLLLHERTAVLQWIGGALIILSMTLIGRKNRRKPC